MPKEDEPRGIIAPLKEKLTSILETLSPANIAKEVNKTGAPQSHIHSTNLLDIDGYRGSLRIKNEELSTRGPCCL